MVVTPLSKAASGPKHFTPPTYWGNIGLTKFSYLLIITFRGLKYLQGDQKITDSGFKMLLYITGLPNLPHFTSPVHEEHLFVHTSIKFFFQPVWMEKGSICLG